MSNRPQVLVANGMPHEEVLGFGEFQLFVGRRLLLRDNQAVALGGRALDLLLALLERPGVVVTRADLIARVWPDTAVVEANINVHIVALRKALGQIDSKKGWLVSAPGQGYRFTGEVRRTTLARGASVPAVRRSHHNLPDASNVLVGREAALEQVTALAREKHLATIIGVGGVGKSVLALALARRLADELPDGVWHVDFGEVANAEAMERHLVWALRPLADVDESLAGLLDALAPRRLLLIFDNVEHLVEPLARVVQDLTARSDVTLTILVTSREPLRVAGEWIHRLSPLAVPDADSASGDAVRSSPAVQLFVERAKAADNQFVVSDADLPLLSKITRKLDGVPLALEFAAARVRAFGVRGLAELLDDELRLLASERRGAPSRHRTLGAVLEWSYRLLDADEQRVLQRLSIFVGSFSVSAARSVAADPDEPASCVDTILASLVSKSMLVSEPTKHGARFRLLGVTRAYVLGRVSELAPLGDAHARFFRDAIDTAWTARGGRSVDEFIADIENLRLALRHVFRGGGDPAFACRLVVVAAPLMLECLSPREVREWAARALEVLPADEIGTRSESVLQSVLGTTLVDVEDATVAAQAALGRARQIAARVGDEASELRALAGLGNWCLRAARYDEAEVLGRAATRLAARQERDDAHSIAAWLLGAASFFVGKYSAAMPLAERVLADAPRPARPADVARFDIDRRTTAKAILAHLAWLHGMPERADHGVSELLDDVDASHPVAGCLAHAWGGCLVSLRTGRLDVVRRSIASLRDFSERAGMPIYRAFAIGCEAYLVALEGRPADAIEPLRVSNAKLAVVSAGSLRTPLSSMLAEVASLLDERDAKELAVQAISLIERQHALWMLPEALRIHGDVLARVGAKVEAAGEYVRACELARQQGALGWELRASTGYALLLLEAGDALGASKVLAPTLERFSERAETPDLRGARALLPLLTTQTSRRG